MAAFGYKTDYVVYQQCQNEMNCHFNERVDIMPVQYFVTVDLLSAKFSQGEVQRVIG
jgi:hypothetical protein